MKHLSAAFNRIVLFCGIALLSLGGCSKDAEDSPAPTPVSVSLEKNQYAPYEAVTIRATANVFPHTFTAQVDDLDVAAASSENLASFILPDLSPGNHTIHLNINNTAYDLPIEIAAVENVLSPDVYFDEITASIDQNIADMNSQLVALQATSASPEEYALLQDDITAYTDLLNDYTSTYNNLTAEEKLEFARSIAANKGYLDTAIAYTDAMIAANGFLRPMETVEDHEARIEAATQAFYDGVFDMAQRIPKIVAGAIIANTPIHPIINAGAIFATGIWTARFLVAVKKTITAAITLTNKSVKPFEHMVQPRLLTDPQESYTSGLAVDRDIQIKYRSIVDTDILTTNSGPTIKKIADKYNYFKMLYNDFRNELPQRFRPKYVMTNLKSNYNSTLRSVYNQYISVSNVSNPKVTVQKIDAPDGSIKIKATTTATTEQTFTYKINYTNSNFTKNLSKTVSAKVTPSSGLYGTWGLTSNIWESQGNQELITSCQSNSTKLFRPDGTYNETYYKLFNGDICQLEASMDGTYTSNDSTLVFSTGVTYAIVLLTDTTLKLRITDNHGTYLETYARQ